MDNIILFVCGLAVTLISGMGVLVYMVHLGYKRQEEIIFKQKKTKEIEAKVDADLGVVENKKDPSMDSFIEIASIS